MRNPFSSRIRVGDDICAVLLLLAVTLGVFWPWLFTGRAFYWGDIGLYFAPFTSYLEDNLHKGLIPLWNPELLCGTPYVGNPQVWPFYPMTALLPWMEPHRYLMVMDAVSIFLAGLFCYRYLTRGKLRLRWPAGFFGALVFMLGGFVVSKSQFPNMLAAVAFLPLCMLQTERLVRNPSARQSAWLGLAFGMQILAAHAQITLMTLYLCAFVALTSGTWRIAPVRRLFVRAGWFFAAGCLAAGLSCAEWLPAIQLWHAAGRHVLGLNVANRFYLNSGQWTNFFWPNRYGHPLAGNFHPAHSPVIYQNYWETACYLGVVPCLLVVSSPLILFRRRIALRHALQWLFILLLSVWLALGKAAWLYRVVFYAVPGVRAFHDPARFLLGASLAAAILSAMVLDRILFRPKKRQALALAFALCCVALTVLDLGRFDRAIYPLKPISEIRGAMGKSVLATALQTDPVLARRVGRVMMVDSERPWNYFTSYKSFRIKEPGFLAKWSDTCVPNLLMSSGILEAGAYEPLAPARAQRRAYQIQHAAIFPAEEAGRMAIEQVIAFRPHPLAPQPALIRLKAYLTSDNYDSIYYYRNIYYRPRARFVDARNGDTADPRVTGLPAIAYERPDTIVVDVPPSLVGRTLVLADTYYPGWSANLGGLPVKIWQTSDGFRKIPIPATPAGSRLVFRFLPRVFLLGLYVTLASLCFFMVRVGVTLARPGKSTARPERRQGGWLFPPVDAPSAPEPRPASPPPFEAPAPEPVGAERAPVPAGPGDDDSLVDWRPGAGTLSDAKAAAPGREMVRRFRRYVRHRGASFGGSLPE